MEQVEWLHDKKASTRSQAGNGKKGIKDRISVAYD
jgi:hypothetical protein